jgi:hypothetical protein
MPALRAGIQPRSQWERTPGRGSSGETPRFGNVFGSVSWEPLVKTVPARALYFGLDSSNLTSPTIFPGLNSRALTRQFMSNSDITCKLHNTYYWTGYDILRQLATRCDPRLCTNLCTNLCTTNFAFVCDHR